MKLIKLGIKKVLKGVPYLDFSSFFLLQAIDYLFIPVAFTMVPEGVPSGILILFIEHHEKCVILKPVGFTGKVIPVGLTPSVLLQEGSRSLLDERKLPGDDTFELHLLIAEFRVDEILFLKVSVPAEQIGREQQLVTRKG